MLEWVSILNLRSKLKWTWLKDAYCVEEQAEGEENVTTTTKPPGKGNVFLQNLKGVYSKIIGWFQNLNVVHFRQMYGRR